MQTSHFEVGLVYRMFKFSKQWPFILLTLLSFLLFVSLGSWQLTRAVKKQHLLQQYQARHHHAPLTNAQLDEKKDLRFYRASLKGIFDNQHTFLLDNKIVQGKVGYEIYTPFYVHGVSTPILIDRGFVAQRDRKVLPKIDAIEGEVIMSGLFNTFPGYFSFGKINENSGTWPQRLQYLDLTQMEHLFAIRFFPLVLITAFDVHQFEIFPMPPEKHVGYAVQWFALALTVLILFVALMRKQAKK